LCPLALVRFLRAHYLHSLPTRRSSDLCYHSTHQRPPIRSSSSTASAGSLMLVAAIFSRRCATEEVPGMSRIVAECCSSHASANRSEEHTSELQSRVDLVCRLLLEKKND